MSSSSSKPLTPNNPLLEVNPSACLLVLGAAATGSKSCRELMEAATRYLQTCKKLSFSAKKKVIAEIKKADKTDVGAALQRAVRILKEADSLSEWLQLVFHEASPTPLSPTLEQCLELQKQGALLACTQLDSLPGTRQATLHDEDAFKSWLSSDTAEEEEEYINVESDDGSIVLHLCGIYTRLDTVWTGDEEDSARNYEPRHKNAFVKFKNILQRRLVIFVGFQGETQNRFVLNFINNFYTQSTERVLKYPPIILTSPNWQRGSSRKEVEGNVFSHFLTLQVQEEDAALLGNLISRGSKRNFSVGEFQWLHDSHVMSLIMRSFYGNLNTVCCQCHANIIKKMHISECFGCSFVNGYTSQSVQHIPLPLLGCLHTVYRLCMHAVYRLCMHAVYRLCMHAVYRLCMHAVYRLCMHAVGCVCVPPGPWRGSPIHTRTHGVDHGEHIHTH